MSTCESPPLNPESTSPSRARAASGLPARRSRQSGARVSFSPVDSIPASVIKDALAASTSRHGALRIPSSVARSLGLMPKAAPQARVGAVDPQTLLTQALRARLGDDAVLSEVRNLIPGRRYRADIVIPDRRLVIEFDGFQYHRSKAAFQKDRERQNLFVAHGWRVLRFFNKQVRDDLDGVVEQIVSLAVARQ